MNTRIALLLPACACFLAKATFAQGTLTPLGPPAPTMQTLDQLGGMLDQNRGKLEQANTTLDEVKATAEKRRAVNASNTPGDATNEHIISQPGSYYLTGNLNVSKTNGITITAPGVTLDLNGFQIARDAGGGSGIRIDAAARSCTIKNGSITGFVGQGIEAHLAQDGALVKLAVSNCGSTGINIGRRWRIADCRAAGNGGVGIRSGPGSVVSHCSAGDNAGIGIDAGVGNTVIGCSAIGNRGSAGIHLGTQSIITHSSAADNRGSGAISAGIQTDGLCMITACTAASNGTTNSTYTGATGAGIIVGVRSKVQNCLATGNTGDGIRAGSDCGIIGNQSVENGSGVASGAGVHVTGGQNRIEGNNVTGNERGIKVDAAENLIIKNSASDSTVVNYDIVANNRYGPIVNITASGTAAVSGNSAGDTSGTTHPWANFAY